MDQLQLWQYSLSILYEWNSVRVVTQLTFHEACDKEEIGAMTDILKIEKYLHIFFFSAHNNNMSRIYLLILQLIRLVKSNVSSL